MPEPLLQVRDLRVVFSSREGQVRAVDGLSYELRAGETLGIVGESGSGKSTEAYAIMGLLPPSGRVEGGSVRFCGRELLGLDRRALEKLRGNEIGMIFQDPLSSLDPAFTVGRQLTETLRAHRTIGAAEADRQACARLREVGIRDALRVVRQYPFELSGGMRQRVMIAMALSCEPRLLIADEPTTALDTTVQEQIVRRLAALRAQSGMAMIFITHNFGLVARLCSRVLVMYGGVAVESGAANEVFARPAHPYTRALLRAIPRMDLPREAPLIPIEGAPPAAGRAPAGCPFSPRCLLREARCDAERPPETVCAPGHLAACWRLGEECRE
jgi:oligopeptide/dipeptide ABC transporter ATP-binding protein